MARGGPIRRTRKGDFELRLPDGTRQLLANLVPQLRATLDVDEPSADPTLRRLFPTAYPDDPTQEAEYRSMVSDDLRRRRIDALDVVEATIDADRLDEAQLTAWMHTINDLRLVLGTLLDVSEDEPAEADPELADADARAIYQYLSYLLDVIVDALS